MAKDKYEVGLMVRWIYDKLESIYTILSGGLSQALSTKDAGPAQTIQRTYTYASALAATPVSVTDVPTTGNKVVLTDLYISVDTACNIIVQMETSANVLASFFMAASSTVPATMRGFLKGDTNGKRIQVRSSVTTKCTVTAVYFYEP